MSNEDKLFEIYSQELQKWNNKFNLTAITDPAEIKLKHFQDSLALLSVLPLTNESIVDVGAGAGFPGIPLKIACPNIKLTLIEATGKKCEFLNHLISALGLKDVIVINARAEEAIKEKRETYDLAVSRAVAELRVLCEYCLPFVKVGGLFVAYKEEKVEAEVSAAKKALAELGGQLKEIKKVNLPDSAIVRSLVVIAKVAPTPLKYPRRAGMAKKRPL